MGRSGTLPGGNRDAAGPGARWAPCAGSGQSRRARASRLCLGLLLCAGCAARRTTDDRRHASPRPQSDPHAAPAPAASDDRRVIVVAQPQWLVPTGKRHQSYVVAFCVRKVVEGQWGEDLLIVELYHDFGGRRMLRDLGITENWGREWMWRGHPETPMRLTVRPIPLRGSGRPGLVVNADLESWTVESP